MVPELTPFEKLISFTRTSAATYVNSAGNIVTTPASKNLLAFTEEFGNAAWVKTGLSVTSNIATAPSGTATADMLTADAGSSTHRILGNGSPAGFQQAFSFYVKAGTHRFVQVNSGANANLYANFDVLDGQVGNVGSLATAFIEPVGDGWFRCGFVGTPATSTGVRLVFVQSLTSSFDQVWTATGAETIYAWGAQIELGSTATSYVRNFGGLFPPRFDYDPVTLQPRGLLIEEQRTNLLLWSEEFDNASWVKAAVTATANATTSPDGTVDADAIIETTASSTHDVNQSATLSAAAHTYSAFVKANGRSWVRLFVFQSGPGSTSVWFNVSTGSVGTVGAGASNATITNFGNGWYRCAFTFTAVAASASLYAQLATADNGPASYTGDGTSGIFLWGAQLEAGAFATSYIPTVASQVTRTADQASIVAPNFAPWYNQSEGTFVVEGRQNAVTGTTSRVVSANDGTINESIQLAVTSTGTTGYAEIRDGGTAVVATAPVGSITVASIFKMALAYKVDDCAISVNGSAVTTDTSATMPTVGSLNIGYHVNSSFLNGHIRRISYYPSRLSNAQLQALSA